MGCVSSRIEEEEEVVSICRQRKNQLKLAVERRYILADAHYRYCQSLFGVSAAINLIVARHRSPPSPFCITFPPPSPPPPKESVVSNPLFLQKAPFESTKEAIKAPEPEPCSSSQSSDSCSEEQCEEKNEDEPKKDEEKEKNCGYFCMDNMPQQMASFSPQTDFEWDFFNPFVNSGVSVTRPEMLGVYNRNVNISEEDLRVVREQEGIPELEDEEGVTMEDEINEKDEKNEVVVTEEVNAVESANVSQGEVVQKGLTIIDTPVRGRELLEALKDIEDHFIRAYDSGKDVSRMLECTRVHLQSNLDEIKESSAKLIQAITWRSASSLSSSSCKSLVASGSKSSSTTWTEFSNELFDDYGGMASGSHLLTLGRLYAWEKKLYEEVKDGDGIRRIYEKKCNQLRNQDVRGDEGHSRDKTRAAVKDLYSRILVAIRRAETVSNNIEKLRDEELEPQINELLQGLMTTWKIMLESHEIQNKIISEVKTFTCPSYGKFSNESHRLATLQLETELLNWRSCMTEYVMAQKGYVEALHGWLSKFVIPETELYSHAPLGDQRSGPHLLTICRNWLNKMNKLPDKTVSFAIRSCAKDVRALWVQQGEEQLQKRRVDCLSKEFERKLSSLQKSENQVSQLRLMDKSSTEAEVVHNDNRDEALVEKKESLESLRRRVDFEKEKHRKLMQETERITLNGFQTGFCRAFEAMAEFSREALNMYNELSYAQNDEKDWGQPCIESKQVGNGSSR